MAGYIIYSLDWDKFQNFVNNPTRKQLLAFAEIVSDGLDGDDAEMEDDDPVRDWPSEPEELCDQVKERLARPDWYGDLSDVGKRIWSSAVDGFCRNADRKTVGFRVDNDGIYWDLLELAWKLLKVEPNQIVPDVALSAFGRRPYHYHPPTDTADKEGDEPEDDDESYGDEWSAHSMHTPDEVRKMLEELRRSGRPSRDLGTSKRSATTTPCFRCSKNSTSKDECYSSRWIRDGVK